MSDEPKYTPIDPDVDLHVAADRAETRPSALPVLGAIAAGGVVGALGRYGLTEALPHQPGSFAWSTFAVNVTGCLLIGVLMTVIGEVRVHRLARPFLGVGVLGGYTTFSAYVVDVQQALDAGAARIALAYAFATMVTALAATWLGSTLTSSALRVLRTRPEEPTPPTLSPAGSHPPGSDPPDSRSPGSTTPTGQESR